MKTIAKVLFLVVLITGVLAVSAYALEDITVTVNSMNIVVNGERVLADNFVYSDTTYVPLRRISEMFGKKVEWDPSSNAALITDSDVSEVTDSTKAGLETEKGKVISVDRNTMNIFVNGVKVEADNFVYSQTTYVPLRKIAEMLNNEVSWEKLSNTASIGKPGISIFDGNVLGTINGVEYTDYTYDYYGYWYDVEEHYSYSDGDITEGPGLSRDEYIMSKITRDCVLFDYAMKNGLSMSPVYNYAYYDSVISTLKGVQGDEERFQRMLEMQGYPSLNAYYYAMLCYDIFNQYCSPIEEAVTIDEIKEHYDANYTYTSQYDINEITDDIRKIIAQERGEKELEKMVQTAVVIKNN